MFNRIRDYLAFTKNEQKVFFFLALVFFAGIAIKVYKSYVVPSSRTPFDYSVQDSVFTARSAQATDDSVGGSNKPAAIRKIDLNRATKTDLMTLPGVGEATAERILVLRGEKGLFKSISDLKKVKGIGEKKFEKLKPYIEVP